jgi:hypothetical protein
MLHFKEMAKTTPSTKSTKLLFVALGSIIPILIIVLIEWSVGFFIENPAAYRQFGKYIGEPDTDLGWRAPSSGLMRNLLYVGESEPREVVYHIDPLSRRRISPPSAENPEKFALFFGGSNVFGDGLSAEKTISAQFEQQNSEFRSYNMAFQAYGPNHMYVQLITGKGLEAIQQDAGIAFYLMYDYHIDRSHHFMSEVGWNGGLGPYVVIEDGRLQHDGSFRDRFPILTRLYWTLFGSNILQALEINLFSQRTHEHLELICMIFKNSAIELAKRGSDLTVAYGNDQKLTSQLRQDCEGPESLQFLELDYATQDHHYRIPGDGHLNERGALKISKNLSRQSRPSPAP